MVKFGKHIEVFNETDNASGMYYVVPYNEIKAHIHPREEAHEEEEEQQQHNNSNSNKSHTGGETVQQLWTACLERASHDFARCTQQFWQRVFARIAHLDVARGALPGTAISFYVQTVQLERQQQNNSININDSDSSNHNSDEEDAQEFLVLLKKIYEVAYRNTEALRKLVKKYDKHLRPNEAPLSPVLLPLLYSANFTVGQPNLELGIDLLRQLLLHDDTDPHYYNNNSSGSNNHNDTVSVGGYESDQSNHNIMVQDRQNELDWLERLTQSMQPWELDRLVAHRYVVHTYTHTHTRCE